MATLAIARLVGDYASGAMSPEEIVTNCLADIGYRNDALGAFDAIDRDGALAAAAASSRRWRAGQERSPIDGVPIAIKANIAVAGLPWTAGMLAYRGRVAERDAPIVTALRAAGALILGTTQMDEGALGATGDNDWYGRAVNPLAADRSPGGSSAGAAVAVAAGLCSAAIGTDTAGSVRIPAAYCGTVGLKPARAALPRAGITSLAPSLDCTGVLAGSVADAIAVLSAVGETVPLPPAIPSVALFGGGSWLEADRRLPATLATAGIGSSAIDPPHDPRRLARLLLAMMEIEGAAVHADLLTTSPETFSAPLRAMFSWGMAQPIARRAEIGEELRQIGETFSSAVGGSVLITPTVAHVAYRLGDPPPADQAHFTAIASILDWPAISLPWDRTPEGLSRSIQITGRDAGAVFGLAALLERLSGR